MNKEVGRKTLVIVLVSLGLILGMGFGLNAALGEGFLIEKPITGSDTVSPTATATLEWMYTAPEDIWELTPPPDWTPPAMTFEKRTPHPSVLETKSPNPTPTFLPDQGIHLSTPIPLTFTEFDMGEIQGIVLEKDKLAFAAYSQEKDRGVLAVLDLNTRETQTITQTRGLAASKFSLSEAYIVWGNYQRNTRKYDVWAQNLATKHTTRVMDAINFVNLSDSTLLWSQGTGMKGTFDILGHSLERQENISLLQKPNDQGCERLNGEWLVYCDIVEGENGGLPLFALNLNTREVINIGIYQPEDYTLRYVVEDNWVVWAEDTELHFYNLQTRETRDVMVTACPWPSSPWNSISYLDISENLLVLSCGQEMGYDIEKQVFFSLPTQVIPEYSHLLSWDLSDKRLVWQMGDGSGNIQASHWYTAKITYTP